MDKVALILSIISLVVSLIIAIWQIISAKRINNVNLQAEFTKEIFKRYVTNDLPKAVSIVAFSNGKLSKIDLLQNSLNSFRQELTFLRFSDNRFYKKFKKHCNLTALTAYRITHTMKTVN